MVRREKAKTAALVLTAIVMTVSIICHYSHYPVGGFGICKGSSILARLLYPFFHASFIHALFNCWSLLAIVFCFDVSVYYILLAYAIAASFPVDTVAALSFIGDEPTVGLSAMCFSLVGMVALKVDGKGVYNLCVIAYIFLGVCIHYFGSFFGVDLAMPNFAIHLYCYLLGLFIAFLNMPAPWKRKSRKL